MVDVLIAYVVFLFLNRAASFRCNWRVTLVLFRTRRRDECSRQKEGVRRRVRKSRQKEAAGAADAGPMQIEWSERGVLKFTGVVKAAGVVAGAPVQRRVDGRSEPTRGQEEDVWM